MFSIDRRNVLSIKKLIYGRYIKNSKIGKNCYISINLLKSYPDIVMLDDEFFHKLSSLRHVYTKTISVVCSKPIVKNSATN